MEAITFAAVRRRSLFRNHSYSAASALVTEVALGFSH